MNNEGFYRVENYLWTQFMCLRKYHDSLSTWYLEGWCELLRHRPKGPAPEHMLVDLLGQTTDLDPDAGSVV